jgi:hypothetical protein
MNMSSLPPNYRSSYAHGYAEWNIYHLFTETKGNSVFCGPETVGVSRGEAKGPQNTLLSRGLSK